MTRDDAKDLTLSILVVVAALLVADNVWLHCKCSSQRNELASLDQKLELHINPPPGPTLKERTKAAYGSAKDAVKRSHEKVKGSFTKKSEERSAKGQ